jgi:hypothetical protein
MSRWTLFFRYVLFCLFFTVGAGAITLSILIDPEMTTYFRNRQIVAEIERQNAKIKDLTKKYQAQIDLVKSNPDVLRRLERVTFGKALHPSEDPSTAALTADNQALHQAAQSILADLQEKTEDPQMPQWFQRCRQPNTRTALFAAGAGLVLITFLFYGSPSKTPTSTKKYPYNLPA